MKNPAREKFMPMLSPYVDGELSPEERLLVEQHLQNNKESAAQVADFRAADALMRHAIDLQGDDVDWRAFTDGVMARVTPEKPPLFERLKVTLSEMFLYQRGTVVAGLAGAALAVAITVPVLMKLTATTPDGYAGSKLEVQTVSVDAESGDVQPVVMETDQGDAIIWTVDAKKVNDPDAGKKKKSKKGGEEGEEESHTTPAPEDQPKTNSHEGPL
jgi:anti-sigma factor RsiW